MNTNVDTSLEHFLSVVEGIEEPCEHREHGSDPKLHEGSGVWQVESIRCKKCSEVSKGLLCDKFFKWVTSGIMVALTCAHCDTRLGYGLETFASIVRKG